MKNVFDSVASKYDLMNDATSFGVHRLWKDTFVSSLRPGRKAPMKCIDVAGGTGDIALRILDYAREKHYDRETTVEVVDINAQMLKEGFRRCKRTMYHNSKRDSTFISHILQHSDHQTAPQISFHEANAQDLGSDKFKDNSYDLYTIAFGIRNCTSISAVLKEAHRVLKPGGTFACLEFSRVNNPLLSTFAYRLLCQLMFPAYQVFTRLYNQYSFTIIPLLGTILAGDRDSYQYLVESIRKFPPQPTFAQMIRDAGFATGKDVDGAAWTDLWGGIATIHTGVKVV